MKTIKKTFGSRFADFLSKERVKFEILYSDSDKTSFRLFDILSSVDLRNCSVKLPYWQITSYDTISYTFIVFETY